MKPKAPERITNISNSHFSVAKVTGTLKYLGKYYQYDKETDSLIRDDILQKEQKLKKTCNQLT